MRLDSFIEPAKQYVKAKGGRVERQEFVKIYGAKLAERMVKDRFLTEQQVVRKDIRGKVKPYEVTYLVMKGWKG